MTDERQVLDRTLLLMRDDLQPDVADERLLAALLGTTVVLHADRANLQSAAGQTALITTALLVARSGAQVFLDIPDVPVQGPQPPLAGESLLTAMMVLGQNLVPGQRWTHGQPFRPADLTIVIGDTPLRASRSRRLVLSGDAWIGSMATSGTRWAVGTPPIGAMAAAALAAGEAYKVAIRRLRADALVPAMFDELFAPLQDAMVELAPQGTPVPTKLGNFDCISGGAITQSALYALARFDLVGDARVIEPETSDAPNLNRYALLLRSHVGRAKAVDLADVLQDSLTVTPIVERYDAEFADRHGVLRSHVLVGVDHIQTRWVVQHAGPEWLGIGATSHYSAMASYHTAMVPCAQCLHPVADDANALIPTVAFVSHWAGLCLAARFVLEQAGVAVPAGRQYSYLTMLRPDSRGAIFHSPVAARPGCRRDWPARMTGASMMTTSADRVA